MARTNAPQTSTYKPATIKFDGMPAYRYGDPAIEKDCQIINMYYERVSQENKEREVHLKKRPGLASTGYSLSKSVSTSAIRGSFYESVNNTFYWAVENKIHAVSPDISTSVRTVATLTTTTGYVGFCSYIKSDSTIYVAATDGEELWIDDVFAASALEVNDPDLPRPHEPSPVYLDGYLFLIKAGTGDIYNSDVDDPFSWDPAGYISTEMSSDWSIRLSKSKNYLVCFGTNSIEYFYDAANTAPGSPLSRYDSPVRNVGYITGLQTIGDTVFFVGQDSRQNIAVYTLESFKVTKISNSVVDRTIQTVAATNNIKSPLFVEVEGFSISVDGHNFYCLTTDRTTWLYDIDEKLWYEWRSSTNNAKLGIEAVWGMYNGACYVAMNNQTNISILSPSIYQDYGVNFTCQYTTEPFSAGTFNWKVLHRLSLDSSTHNYVGTSNVQVTWSDEDWSDGGITTPRDINVFSASTFTSNCGRFRNRSFRIKYTDNYPFFMKSIELDLNVMGI